MGDVTSPHHEGAIPLARLFAMAFSSLIDGLHERLAERGWADVRRSYGFVLLAARGGPLSAGAITDMLGVTKQATSQLFEAMELDGYISRRIDPHDARARVISITAKGQRLLKVVESIYAELEQVWARTIGEDAVVSLRTSLLAALRKDDGTLPPVRPTL